MLRSKISAALRSHESEISEKNSAFESRLSEATRRHESQLLQERLDHRQAVEELQRLLSSKAEFVEKLSLQLTELRNANFDALREGRQKSDEVDSLRQQLQDAQSRCKILTEELSQVALRTESSAQADQIAASRLENQLAAEQSKISSLQMQVTLQAARIEGETKRNQETAAHWQSKYASMLSTKDGQLLKAENERQAAVSSLAAEQRSRLAAESRLQELEADVQRLEDALALAQRRCTSATEGLSIASRERERLENQLGALKETARVEDAQRERQIRALENAVRETKLALEASQEQVNRLSQGNQSELVRLQRELSSAENWRKVTESKLAQRAEVDVQLAASEERCRSLEHRIREMETEAETRSLSLEKFIQDLKNDPAMTAAKEAGERVKQLERELAVAQRDALRYQLDADRLAAEVQSAREDSALASQRYAKLEDDLTRTRNVLSEERRRVEQLMVDGANSGSLHDLTKRDAAYHALERDHAQLADEVGRVKATLTLRDAQLRQVTDERNQLMEVNVRLRAQALRAVEPPVKATGGPASDGSPSQLLDSSALLHEAEARLRALTAKPTTAVGADKLPPSAGPKRTSTVANEPAHRQPTVSFLAGRMPLNYAQYEPAPPGKR